MSQSETRAPLPAVTHVSPLIEQSDGTLYPYWDVKQSGLSPYINALRRTFASINPFSHQQVPTSERMAIGIRNGWDFYRAQPYPTTPHFYSKYPVHYDPLNDERYKQKMNMKHFPSIPEFHIVPIVPRFCEREIRSFKRCVVANDNNQAVCKQEQDNIIAICPQWALHNLKEKKLGLLKDEAMTNKKYREVMKVSSYNKGRTVADVPLRSWSDGDRQNLRPATLWADDRYADITQEEVAAAKERMNKRRQANPLAHKAQIPTYNRTYQAPNRQVPLYSV